MKQTYNKPMIDIESVVCLSVFAASPNTKRFQEGDTFRPGDTGEYIPTLIEQTSAIDYSPYENGQGYGTNRANENNLWED